MSSLLEPCALNRRMHGSEGRGGQQCPPLTRACRVVGSKVSYFTLPTRGRTASSQRDRSFTDTTADWRDCGGRGGEPDPSAQDLTMRKAAASGLLAIHHLQGRSAPSVPIIILGSLLADLARSLSAS